MNKLILQFILLTLVFLHLNARGQSLSAENFRYYYDPENEIKFDWNISKNGSQMSVLWSVSATVDESNDNAYLLRWERRDSYSKDKGVIIQVDSLVIPSAVARSGELVVDISEKPWLLVAKLTKLSTSHHWLYTHLIENKFPVNGFITLESGKSDSRFAKKNSEYVVKNSSSVENLFVYYYKQEFPSAFPPFSTKAIGSDPVILHDSTFMLSNNSKTHFKNDGLYLVQSDTLSAEGFSFRVTSAPFPKYNRVEDLIPPLIFIATKEEFTELENANGDKAKFDKTILGITKDKDRAKRFMRSYYGRVELANAYFTSFKEGWKTDRGMIYVIFGLPDEVRLTDQNEIWYYKNTRTKFVFVKRGSIYDPNYYVLERDAKFTELWYSTIDLWRKSRF